MSPFDSRTKFGLRSRWTVSSVSRAQHEGHQHHRRDDGQQRRHRAGCAAAPAARRRRRAPCSLACWSASVSQRIRPRGRPTLSIVWLQASMHRPQPMHSICWPSRMSIPVGQTATHRLQSTQSPRPSQLVARLVLAARLAAPVLVGDDDALLVEHRRLEARPRAHVGADLLARPAGQQVGRGREQADEEIDLERGLAAEDLAPACWARRRSRRPRRRRWRRRWRARPRAWRPCAWPCLPTSASRRAACVRCGRPRSGARPA